MRSIAFAAGAAVVLLTFGSSALASGGWTPTKTQGLTLKGTSLGDVSPATPLHVAVSLEIRDLTGLQSGIQSGTQLSAAQFGAQYAPTAGKADAVRSYLVKEGFTNVAVEQNRLFVTADATAARADAAFDTKILSWSVNGKTMFANATPAQVPSALGGVVLSVLGLNDAATMSG
ncbi:MAG: protease pro-enzyme activation domain-containing protein, partial [Trebonia sp.]